MNNEYYIIANKDKTEYLTRTSGWNSYNVMEDIDIQEAIMFHSLLYAQEQIQDYVGDQLNGNLNQYQIIKIKINVIEENIKPYNKVIKFSYTTSQSKEEITKEDVKSMLMFKFGIDKDFDYKLSVLNPRCRTHTIKVELTFKD